MRQVVKCGTTRARAGVFTRFSLLDRLAFPAIWADSSREMAPLNLEEQGLLQVLERIERGDAVMSPSLRFGLASEGLIEGSRTALSPQGKRVLEELRVRSLGMGEFPTLLVAGGRGAEY